MTTTNQARSIEQSLAIINAYGWTFTVRGERSIAIDGVDTTPVRLGSTEITKRGFGSIMTAGGTEAQRLSKLVDNLLVSERRAGSALSVRQ